jgi:hypothetical protein
MQSQIKSILNGVVVIRWFMASQRFWAISFDFAGPDRILTSTSQCQQNQLRAARQAIVPS